MYKELYKVKSDLNILNVIYIEKDKENVRMNVTDGINHLMTRFFSDDLVFE